MTYPTCPRCGKGRMIPMLMSGPACDLACERERPKPAEGYFIEKPWFDTEGEYNVELLSVCFKQTRYGVSGFEFKIHDLNTRTEKMMWRGVVTNQGAAFWQWCIADIKHIFAAFGLPNDDHALEHFARVGFTGDHFNPSLAVCMVRPRSRPATTTKPAKTWLRAGFRRP